MVVEQWEGATGADKATIFVTFSALEGMLDGLRSMTDIFYGVALVLLGVGIALSTVYPRSLGWVIIVAGVIWTVIRLCRTNQPPRDGSQDHGHFLFPNLKRGSEG